MDIFFESISNALRQIGGVEIFSVICSVIQVLLSRNNKTSNYAFGILGIVSGMYVLFNAKLYAEIVLNVYYLVMSIYGWWYWTTNREAQNTPITKCSRSDWKIVFLIVIIGFVCLYVALEHFTDSDVPFWDAWVSATAWAGMWLLAKRKIENWILLNLSNLFAIPLLIHKEIYLFAALTIFLFIIAISGFLNWKKIMQNQKNIQNV